MLRLFETKSSTQKIPNINVLPRNPEMNRLSRYVFLDAVKLALNTETTLFVDKMFLYSQNKNSLSFSLHRMQSPLVRHFLRH